MKKMILVVLILVSMVVCSKGKDEPFTTSEWRSCFEGCEVSMPKNLTKMGFSEEEIKATNVDRLCVVFCTKQLKQKRGIIVE